MSSTFPSFSINDGDWVRVRQFIQRVSSHDLQGEGNIIPYINAVSDIALGDHTLCIAPNYGVTDCPLFIQANTRSNHIIQCRDITGITRNYLHKTGYEIWQLNSGSAEIGKIGYGTPGYHGGGPGIAMYFYDSMAGLMPIYRNPFYTVHIDTAVVFGFGSDGVDTLTIKAGDLVGINTINPTTSLTVRGITTIESVTGGGAESLYVEAYSVTEANTANIYFRKSHHDTVRSHGATLDTEALGTLTFQGNTGAAFTTAATIAAIQIGAGGTAAALEFDADLYHFNPTGIDQDLQVEGNTDTALLYCDAGNDRVGIGTSTPAVKLDIKGQVRVGTPGTTTDFDVDFYGKFAGGFDNQFHWDANSVNLWFGQASNSIGGLYNFASGVSNTVLLNYNIVIGFSHNVNGSYNAVFGRGHTVTSNYAFTGGYTNVINDQYAFAAGRNNTVSYSAGAIGRGNTASGSYSFSVGYNNSSTGIEAMSFGLGNNADHSVAIMIGNGNSSTGNYAYCIGNGNSAGVSAVAIGYYNTASANYSISIGRENTSSGANAITLGRDLTASADTAIAIGRNITNAVAASVKIGITNSLFFGTATSLRINDDGADIDVVIEGDTDTDLFHSDASTDRIGISTATPATTLDVLGTTRLGDSATNYAQFAADGELTLAGTARVKKRIMIPLTAVKHGAVDPPSEGSVDGFRTLDFDGVNKDEEVFKPFCGPLDWASGTGCTVNLRFFVDTAPAGAANVVWQVEVKSIACEGIIDFSSGTSTYTDIVAITTGTPANDKKVHCSELTIPAGDLIEGGCLFIRLHRDATHASDTFTGDARLLKTFITYTANKLGEAI